MVITMDVIMIDRIHGYWHDQQGNNPYLLSEQDHHMIEEGLWTRAHGDCECVDCDLPFWKHPQVLGATWLRRLCDGRLVKL